MLDGLTVFALAVAGGVLGGTVSAIVEHWLATPGPDPPARWRRGTAWVMEAVRREQLGVDRRAGELGDDS